MIETVPKRFCIIAAVIIFSVMSCFHVHADTRDIPAVCVGEDEVNGYRYECPGVGGFSTNVYQKETHELVIITADQGLRSELYHDGDQVNAANDDLIFENGSYQYYLYPEEDKTGIRGIFTFSVSNQYGEQAEEQSGFSVIEEPKLQITRESGNGPYRYQLPNGSVFSMTVPIGAVTVDPVAITISDNDAIFEVLRDGGVQLIPQELIFSEAGTYRLLLVSSQPDISASDTNTYRVFISFNIQPAKMNDMDFINAPVDFSFYSLTRDGVELDTAGDTVYMEEDGRYRAVFFDKSDSSITYETEFMIDRQAPYLKFSKTIYENILKPSVSYQPSENGCIITARRNGEKMARTDNLITEGGIYSLSVQDEAGNVRTYNFSVEHSVCLIDWRVIIISVVFVVSMGVWLCYLRRHMRIL